MKFGKVNDPLKIDFRLPEDDPATKMVLERATGKGFNVAVGCAKWNKTELKGFYPKGVKDELEYYAQQFNSIELNSTFYNTPSVTQIIKWKEKTPKGFRFFPKINNSISHYKRLLNVKEATEEYCNAIANFEEKLGMVFLQLHENFSPREYEKLQIFIKQFPASIPLTIELRNPEWFKDEKIWLDYCRLMEKQKRTNTIVDTPGRRDMLHMRLTTPAAFIRWVGCNNKEVDFPRLDAWITRIKKWRQQGLKELDFFVHQGVETSSPVFAKYFIEKLNKTLNLDLKIPKLPEEEQAKLF